MKKIKRVIAVLLVMAVIIVSVPLTNILASDTKTEEIFVKVRKAEDTEYLENVTFKANDKDITAAMNDDKEYEMEISLEKDEKITIYAYYTEKKSNGDKADVADASDASVEYIGEVTITYDEIDYRKNWEIELTQKLDIVEIEGLTADDTNTYRQEKNYESSKALCEFQVKNIENVTAVTDAGKTTAIGCNISVVDGIMKVTYASPGRIYIVLSSEYANTTYIDINIKNTISFKADVYEKEISENNITFSKKAEAAYQSSVEYTSNDKSVATIDKETGDVTIKKTGEVKITATCSITNVKDDYTLKIYPTTQKIIIKDEDSRIISDNQELVYDMLEREDKPASITVYADTDKYDIKYESTDESVATLNDGRIYINGVGETVIKVKAESKKFYLSDVERKFKVKVKSSDVKITISDDELTFIDNKNESDIEKDEYGNGTALKLPVEVKVYDLSGKEIEEGVRVEFSASGLNFENNIIKNPDSIERNKTFEVTVRVSSPDKKFNEQEKKIKVTLNGDSTNNKGYYTISGIRVGADGNIWKVPGESVKITGNDCLVSTNTQVSSFAASAVIKTSASEPVTKEHKIYVMKDDILINAREFFGVDENAPVINAINYSQNVNSKEYGKFADGSIAIQVIAGDKENNLYEAKLCINGEVVMQTSISQGSCTFNLSEEEYMGINRNVRIEVSDASGNTAVSRLGDILIEKEKAEVSYNVLSDDDELYKDDNGNIYSSEDMEIEIKIKDIGVSEDTKEISGLESYEIYINDKYFKKIEVNSAEKKISDTYIINTSEHEKINGVFKVEVRNATDNAKNIGNNENCFMVYVDDKAPEIVYENTINTGRENKTSFCNFYSADAKLIFKATDIGSGINKAIVYVGEKETHLEEVTDGVVEVKLKVGDMGDVKVKLIDNVGMEVTYLLSEIKNSRYEDVYQSSKVLVENIGAKVTFTPSRDFDKNDWYNKEVSLNIAIDDDYVQETESSGLKMTEIYINDVLYTLKSLDGYNQKNDSFTVTINNEWIEKVKNSEGTYTVKVRVTDNAQNVSENEKTVKIDAKAPVIKELSGVEAGGKYIGVATVLIGINEEHYYDFGLKTTVSVEKILDGEKTTYEASKFIMTSEETTNAYTFGEDGTYTVKVLCEDAAGNKSEEKSIWFTVDNTKPIANIEGVVENGYYTDEVDVTIDIIESNYEDTNVSVTISKELNGEVSVITKEIKGTGKISSIVQNIREEGKYTIRVEALDAAGNVAVGRVVMFTVDAGAPEIIITGVENRKAYKDEVVPKIKITDNYFESYSISLVKTGVYYNEDRSFVNSFIDQDVTKKFTKALTPIENGVEGTLNMFTKTQENDGIYTLVVTARDLAGRTSQKTVVFSVNRYGSVYIFDENLKSIINSYVQEVKNDFIITEYNADKVLTDSVNIRITRDGSLLDNVKVEMVPIEDELDTTGWYAYNYIISKENFDKDGVYVISVTSQDDAGNVSETITYDELAIRFFVDTTKPELVKVTGLSEDTYNADKIDVSYEVFDAIALKEIRVYVSDKQIQKINEFDDVTLYAGKFSIEEGMSQNVRFEIEDKAGNVTNSADDKDVKDGKVVNFANEVTVSTNIFIRWYANKVLFYGTIAGSVLAVAGGTGIAIIRKIKR